MMNHHQATDDAPPPCLTALLTFEQVADKYPIFPSAEAVRVYVRFHRAGLEEAGALLVIRGRTYLASGPFEAYVLRAGQEQAAERGRAAAAAAAKHAI